MHFKGKGLTVRLALTRAAQCMALSHFSHLLPAILRCATFGGNYPANRKAVRLGLVAKDLNLLKKTLVVFFLLKGEV